MGTVEPHLFVIFGATGDLASRKMLPALERLDRQGRLPDAFAIVAVGRREDLDDRRYRDLAHEALVASGCDAERARSFCERRIVYHPLKDGRFTDLDARLAIIEKERGIEGGRVFYLALPPTSFPDHISGIGDAGLQRAKPWTRLVIEKPFGRDLYSARELNRLAHAHFDESQLYRIDHYLGKDTVQNLLTFRFANALFESAWSRDRVECVEITSSEELGVGRRAGYYEQAGALRDMVQNHLTQVLSLVAMEPPATFGAGPVRNEKIKVLEAIDPIRPEDVILGQYRAGRMGDGPVAGYREESGVAADSRTETYVALRLHIANWRWQGVPFYLRTGKRLSRRLTQVAVTFRRPPICLFKSLGTCETHSNVLLMTLQPDEGFSLSFDVKAPGEPLTLKTLPLHFSYSEAFAGLSDAYETLLLDVMRGDQTLFVHGEETEASWRLYAPVLNGDHAVHPYPAGGVGPLEADRLLEDARHRWQCL
jgi:glucose-6-phosphate 1-dehydrogenase